MIYLVAYDLAPRRRLLMRLTRPPMSSGLHPFYQELEQSRSWLHYLDKTWLISTEETLQQLDQRLRQHIAPTDKLLIVKFSGEYAGWLPKEAWQWIDERMSAGELVG